MAQSQCNYEVIIAGAGPVGLCLAIDLGRRGVKTLIVERDPVPAPWPKMDRTNARSMEMLARIGLADPIRALGYPADFPLDVYLMSRLSEPPLVVLPYPSVNECRKQVARTHDGSLPAEPYQLVSQNKVEPFLKEVAEASPNITVEYGHEVIDFTDASDTVSVKLRGPDGAERELVSNYLVGCDGGASTVRKLLDISLEGQGGIRDVVQVIFQSDDLVDKIPYGKGRHYSFTDHGQSLLVVQGDRKEFTLHTSLPADYDFHTHIRELIGFDCNIRILHIVPWRYNLLLAERYGAGRVLIAGDACHLVIPTGGLGFNSGLGDAFDLSWKLAASLRSWGGPGLLQSYETERRPVARRNIEASGSAAAAVPVWQALVTPEAYEPISKSADLRHTIAKSFRENHDRMHRMRGAEFGYSYAGSPVIADEPDNAPEWDIDVYTPHSRPGVRIPHMWLSDGRPMQDALGYWYTLLDLTGDCDSTALEAAFAGLGAPLEVARLPETHIRETFGKSLFLLRPDLHIAWRGDALPDDCDALVKLVTGWA